MKVNTLCKQLEEAQHEALKCNFTLLYPHLDKRLMDEINSNKYKPAEVMRIAESLGISPNAEDYTVMDLRTKAREIDSSMDALSITDSSSYVSDQSSCFSLDSKERSCSNDLRQSFESSRSETAQLPRSTGVPSSIVTASPI